MIFIPYGNVEKINQQRPRHFVVLTYRKYTLRVKMAAALLEDFFDHSRRLFGIEIFLGYIRAFL